MVIREATTPLECEQIIDMAKDHPAPEYDCSFAEFSNAFKKLFGSPSFRAWILYDDNSPVGYVSGWRKKLLTNEIDVFDIFLKARYRGNGNLRILTDRLKEWAILDKALRVNWTSRKSGNVWPRLLGLKLSEYHTFVWEVNDVRR